MRTKFQRLRMQCTHSLCRFVLILLPLLFFSTLSTNAQNQLSRISTVDRSDGKGAVIRYHFEQAIDSFEVLQPAPDFIQMVLYDTDIDTSGIRFPGEGQKVKQVFLYELDYGYGVDIYLGEDQYFRAEAYPDMNGKHLLVALTETTYEDINVYSQQFIARTWYDEVDFSDEDFIIETVQDTGSPSDTYNPIKDKLKFDKIVIDPGHGGHDPGNIGYNKKVKEKDVNLQIAKKLGNYIEKGIPGVEVVYTREDDSFVDLWERGSIANREEADLFVSIHADGWHQSSVRGASVFFLGLKRSDRSFEVMKKENQIYGGDHGVMEDLSEEDLIVYELAHSGNIAASERIAYLVEDQIKNRARRKSRGVKQNGFVVLYQSTMPAILVETGFLTNPAEQRYLTSKRGQEFIASAIYRAIKEFKKQHDAGHAEKSTTAAND